MLIIIIFSNIVRMFYNCSSLTKFPDLSKWYIKNVINKEDIFKGTKVKIPKILNKVKKGILFINSNNISN